jgi:hypothetical protein
MEPLKAGKASSLDNSSTPGRGKETNSCAGACRPAAASTKQIKSVRFILGSIFNDLTAGPILQALLPADTPNFTFTARAPLVYKSKAGLAGGAINFIRLR